MREADFFCMIIVIVIVAVLLSVNWIAGVKNEMAWFLFPGCRYCSHHDRADSIGEYMETIEAVLFVCIAAAVIAGFIINVW